MRGAQRAQGVVIALVEALGADRARNHEGLRFNVEQVEYETLPRYELKAKRLKDTRSYE